MKIAIRSLAIGLLTSISLPAMAQTAVQVPPAAADDNTGLAEIVVTAQKRAQALSDVPLSVSVVGGEQLKAGGVSNFVELAVRLPNVNLYEGGQSDTISIRGIASGANAGFEQAVATFVDGAYRGRSRSIRAAFFDVERIEVLRGPQSTFFGNSAIAGAFNVTTRRAKPGQSLQGDLLALYEFDHKEYNVQGGLSAPLGETLAARVAVQSSGIKGWTRNTSTGRTEPDRNDQLGRISLAWEPSASWKTDFRIDGGRSRTKGVPLTNEITNCPPPAAVGLPARGACAAYLAFRGANADTRANRVGAAPATYANNDYGEAALTNELTLGDYTVTAVSTYFQHKFDQSIALIPVDAPSPAGGGSFFEFYSGERFKQLTQDVRLQSPTDAGIRFTLGGYYLYGKLKNYIRPVPAFLPFGNFLAARGYNATTRFAAFVDDRRTENLYSVYGLANIDLTQRLRLNVSSRYSISDKTAFRSLTSGTVATNPFTLDANFSAFQPASAANQVAINNVLGFQAGNFPNTKRSDKRFMPSAGVEYDITTDILNYASYTRGAKSGGWSMGASANEFNDETVDAYEVGIKGTVLNRRLFFSVAAFRSDYRDLQEASNNALPNGSFVILVQNAARARAQGVELSLNARVNRFVAFNFDGSYLDAKYTSFPGAPCNTIQSALTPVGCVQDLSGRRRPLASTWSGSFGVDVRLPAGPNQVRFNPILTYRSRYNTLTTLDPITYQRGYAKLDARLSYGRDGVWDIAFVGKNLTNTDDALFINTLVSAPGSSALTLSRPRSVALQGTYNF